MSDGLLILLGFASLPVIYFGMEFLPTNPIAGVLMLLGGLLTAVASMGVLTWREIAK